MDSGECIVILVVNISAITSYHRFNRVSWVNAMSRTSYSISLAVHIAMNSNPFMTHFNTEDIYTCIFAYI